MDKGLDRVVDRAGGPVAVEDAEVGRAGEPVLEGAEVQVPEEGHAHPGVALFAPLVGPDGIGRLVIECVLGAFIVAVGAEVANRGASDPLLLRRNPRRMMNSCVSAYDLNTS